MAISLAISITRFHSQRVDVVKSGEEKGVEDREGGGGVGVGVGAGGGEEQFLLSQL